MRSTRKIAILGGSFDPPHAAHIEIARRAVKELGVERVLLVVAGDPYQKRAQASAEQRYEMTCLATKGLEGVEVSRIEVERPGPSYTIDTVEELAAEDPAREVWVILGSDALEGITTWHRWEELLARAKICVVPRQEYPLENALSVLLARKVDYVVMDLDEPLPYSSSYIRAALASGIVPEGVDPLVAGYIEENGLYRGAAATGG